MRNLSEAKTPTGWRDLYVAALFETDCSKLGERIAEAEKALVFRARELFQTAGDHIEEEYAMDDAMYALRALWNTYQCRTSAANAEAEAA
jgi:hypothetical protein